MRPEAPTGDYEMNETHETPPAAFETNVITLNPAPDERAELERQFKQLNAGLQIMAAAVADFGLGNASH